MKPHDQWNSRDIAAHVYSTRTWAHPPKKRSANVSGIVVFFAAFAFAGVVLAVLS